MSKNLPKGGTLLVSALALALVAASILALLSRGGSPGLALEAVANGPVPAARVVVVARDPNDVAGPMVMATADGTLTELTGSEPFAALRISPDGNTVAGLVARPTSADARLLLVDVTSRQVTTVQLATQDVPLMLAWSPDSRYVAIDGGTLQIVTRAGQVVALTGLGAAIGSDGVSVAGGGFGWSPDSRTFATSTNGELRVYRPDAVAASSWLVKDLAPDSGGVAWFAGFAADGDPVFTLPAAGKTIALEWAGTGQPTVDSGAQAEPATRPDLAVPVLTRNQMDKLTEVHPGFHVLRARRLQGPGAAVMAEATDGKRTVLVAFFADTAEVTFELSGLGPESNGGALYDGWADR